MALDTNVSPYYDDFDPNKNFHKILFKPGNAVQARELIQSQTILQSQISTFASAIYTQNTPVSGGNVTLNSNCKYLKLNSAYNNTNINVQLFKNKTITDSSGTILAKVIATLGATGTTIASDPPTLIITYLSGTVFSDGMVITTTDGSNIFATTIGLVGATTSTGSSSVASISEGVFYVVNGQKKSTVANADGTFSEFSVGNFVSVGKQTIVLSKYAATTSYRIGLDISEYITTAADDPTLLDPAVGASNYQAPGADRYTIQLILTTKDLILGNDDNFIELVRVVNGVTVKQVDSTSYSKINDYFAKRTFDTNGDFIVEDFNLTPTANTSNTTKYNMNIGKGIAYIRGYRVESQAEVVLPNDRARTTATQNNSSIYCDVGQYFYVDSANGLFDISTLTPIDMHSVTLAGVLSSNTQVYNSTLVGSAYIRGLSYVGNATDSVTSTYRYKANITDITLNVLSGNVSSATSTTATLFDLTSKFSYTANAYYNCTITIDSGTGSGYTGKVYSYSSKVVSVIPAFSITPDATSKFSIRFNIPAVESLVTVTSGTTNILSRLQIANAGKVGGASTGDTILYDTQRPELVYNIGHPFIKDQLHGSYLSTKILRNKSFTGGGTSTLSVTLPVGIQNAIDFAGGTGTLSAETIKQNYTVIVTSTTDTVNNGPVGSIMDWVTTGNTVSISTDKNTLSFSSTKYTTPLTVAVIAKINVTNADDASNILRTKTLVLGDLSQASYTGVSATVATYTKLNLPLGQVYINNAGISDKNSLYVIDVKKIVKIIDTLDVNTVPTVNMLTTPANDITSNYTLFNGQKDSFYDHSTIYLNSGAPKPKGNILVVFDYYLHSGGDGYFSGRSYINESYSSLPGYVATSGNRYSLRDSLDFRPSRQNATASFALLLTADPATNDTGAFIPQDLTNFTTDYSYYLGRKDRLVLTKDNQFQIIRGQPDLYPVHPTIPDGGLLIANLIHDPYTGYLPSEAPAGVLPSLSVEKIQHKRWTMNDISDLQARVNNIEYYTALTALEQATQSIKVTDNNGLNRFKNGILVDDFSSYSVADTYNLDFSASIDKVTKQMTAPRIVDNFPLQSFDGISSLNNVHNSINMGYAIHTIGKGTNIFTLPYTNIPVIEQKLASSTINVNPFSVPLYEGICNINPPMDNWIDNTKQPDLLFVDPSVQIYQQSSQLNTLAVSNWQTIPGTQYSVLTNSDISRTAGWVVGSLGHARGGGGGASDLLVQTTNIAQSFDDYARQTQTTTTGYWSNLGPSYSQNNGFITDVSVQPYIRGQYLTIRANSLKVNTPVHCFFDKVIVDKYMITPDTIELTNVTGTFYENNLLGYYDININAFNPIGTVLGVYSYPNTSNVRLYVIGNFHTDHKIISSGNSLLLSGKFNTTGTYIGSTASGTVSTSKIISTENSGYICAVGGTFTDAAANTAVISRSIVSGCSDFLMGYGTWNSPTKSGIYNVSYSITVSTTGTYYFQFAATDSGNVYIDGGASVISSTSGVSSLYSATLTAGVHTIRVYATGATPALKQVGLAISSLPWTSGQSYNIGNIIFSTVNHTYVTSGVTSISTMSGGGSYYSGVTKIALNPTASTVTDYYVGSSIYITTTTTTQTSVSQQVYESVISAYDATTNVVTFSPAADISVGFDTIRGGLITSSYSLNGTVSSYILAKNNNLKNATFSTNESGDFIGVFIVPPSTFRTGDRVFRIDDRLVVSDDSSTTTWAEATFTASGLKTTSQALNYAPTIAAAKNTFTSTAAAIHKIGAHSTASTTQAVLAVNVWDPVAQTFIIDKANHPNGCFISEIRIFFASKPLYEVTPITLSVVSTSNGYPSETVLSNSIVTLKPSDIKVSTSPHYLDTTTYTTFTFSVPIYIQPEVLYAFILKSQSLEYVVYSAGVNETALTSSVKQLPTDAAPRTITKIGAAPYIGSLFESQNAITWTANQSKSLMFSVNKCSFNIANSPKVKFSIPKGLPKRKSIVQDIQKYYGDYSVDNTSNIYSRVNIPSDSYNISTTDFTPSSTTIDYSFRPTLLTGSVADIEYYTIPGKFGTPTYTNIRLNDGKGERVLLANTNDSFLLYSQLSSLDTNVSPIVADDGLSLYNIQYRINNLVLSNTNIAVANGGTNYQANTTTITISPPDAINGSQAYASANVVNGIIQRIYITTEGSGYLKTPTITIIDSNVSPGTGAVANAYSEFSPNNGNAIAKYITKKTTLTVGNDSADLRVYVTAYRPVNTDIYVFYRIQNRNDTQLFETGTWQLMTYVNNTNNYSKTENDLKEFEAAPGVNYIANNALSYTSTAGTTYTQFSQFAIKVVLVTADKSNPPFLTDIRALALPSGTGL